jgi:hypothetical protein
VGIDFSPPKYMEVDLEILFVEVIIVIVGNCWDLSDSPKKRLLMLFIDFGLFFYPEGNNSK